MTGRARNRMKDWEYHNIRTHQLFYMGLAAVALLSAFAYKTHFAYTLHQISGLTSSTSLIRGTLLFLLLITTLFYLNNIRRRPITSPQLVWQIGFNIFLAVALGAAVTIIDYSEVFHIDFIRISGSYADTWSLNSVNSTAPDGEIHTHITYNTSERLWEENSEIYLYGKPEMLKPLLVRLKAAGWKVEKAKATLHTTVPSATILRGHLTATTMIPVISTPSEFGLYLDSEKSNIIVDAPQSLVIETFPAITKYESLVENNKVRMRLPFEHAFDEGVNVRIKACSGTWWSKTASSGLKLAGDLLKWIADKIVFVLGTITTGIITAFAYSALKIRKEQEKVVRMKKEESAPTLYGPDGNRLTTKT